MAEGADTDEFALTYYNRGELGFIHEAARKYTLYDRFFCSLLASTWPNRYYKWSAQSGGRKDNTPPFETGGNQWETIFDRAIGRGLSARYYNSDLPLRGGVGAARRGLDQPDRPLLRGLRRRNAAEHRHRRSAVQGRRRRRRPLRRRAPARRHPARAGVHGRRRQRLRDVAELPPWGDLRRLRRVGRLLRPRPAATCGRWPGQLQPRRGLRPDGLPHPVRGGLALHEESRLPAIAWTTARTGSSRSSS